MKSEKLILLFALFPFFLLLSCQDQDMATEPESIVEPSFGKPPDSLDPTAQRITSLIEALYPDGGLQKSALKDWEDSETETSGSEGGWPAGARV